MTILKPAHHHVARFEQRARFGAVAALGALIIAAIVGFTELERASRAAVGTADTDWRASGTAHKRLWVDLLQIGNTQASGGTLTSDGCDSWTVAEAKKRWAVDAGSDLRVVRRFVNSSGLVASEIDRRA